MHRHLDIGGQSNPFRCRLSVRTNHNAAAHDTQKAWCLLRGCGALGMCLKVVEAHSRLLHAKTEHFLQSAATEIQNIFTGSRLTAESQEGD